MDNPYKILPSTSFWRRSVASVKPIDFDPVVAVPFGLSKKDRIATAGSCFAQHIARELSASGYHYLVTEDGPAEQNFRVFPARFGNVYTPRQLLQLFERAYGLFHPVDTAWVLPGGEFVDPFRPQAVPGGFASVDDLKADRERHLAAVRTMFEEADVFVFTLGLTEGWRSRADGAVVPLAPGVAGRPQDDTEYEFHNFDVAEMRDDMKEFIDKVRRINPGLRLIFTVSPVPLVATYEPKHVLVATTYSKAALRVVAEMITRDDPDAVYFPSYEIITGPQAKYAYYEDGDLRSVTAAGVAHVMRVFGRHFFDRRSMSEVRPNIKQDYPRLDPEQLDRESEALQRIICDEEAIDT